MEGSARKKQRLDGSEGSAGTQGSYGHPFVPTLDGGQGHPKEPDQVDGLPQGWTNCPPMGDVIGYFVPCKTPLGARHMKKIPPGHEFTPGMALEMAQERFGKEIGMVIDLTNTKRYYDPRDWLEHNLFYVKMPCRGRGQTPEPATVNDFMWTAMCFHNDHPERLILVHCTHGFNRTGFMITNYIMRMGQGVKLQDNTIEKAINMFAKSRQPGIYKDHYIEELYKYHHMRRPSALKTPAVPAWKGADSPPGSPTAENDQTETEIPNELWQHDDPLGEAVHPDMAEMLKLDTMRICMGSENIGRNRRFPGSQPVSLDGQNLEMLKARRYYVTWKADGTRYMLLIRADGAYLIDRSFKITRVEMRFPTAEVVPHHFTLLDGEMVVDEDLESGLKTRRFLVYDLMMSKGASFVQRPFKDRFTAIHQELIGPRDVDKRHANQGKSNYNYGLDLFSVRRKDFWQLHTSQKVLDKVITHLSHESDGLIFQSWEDPYKPGTCDELLKWKFASHNSVDFLFRIDQRGEQQLLLLETRRGMQRGNVPLEGGRVVFPQGDAESHNGTIVECRYLKGEGVWEYMRTRTDKNTPNAYHVYEKVLKSIHDNITQEVLLRHIDGVVREATPYSSERRDLEARQQRGR